MKLVALLDGGDWYDASVLHILIPEDMDLEKAGVEWRRWYNEVYLPGLRANKKPEYISFDKWLIQHGAQEATENEIIQFWVS